MKDWCIVTGASGPHTQFLSVTVPTLQRYAEVFDMDLRGDQWFEFESVPPSWSKIPLLERMLDLGYEGVLWIDADAEFVRFDEDIRPLATGKWNWVHNEYLPATGVPWRCVPCAGVVAVTQGAQPILDEIWALRDTYRNHGWWEQRAALEVFGWDEATGALKNGGDQAALPARWNSTPESPADDPVVYHASGVHPLDRRVGLLREAQGTKLG